MIIEINLQKFDNLRSTDLFYEAPTFWNRPSSLQGLMLKQFSRLKVKGIIHNINSTHNLVINIKIVQTVLNDKHIFTLIEYMYQMVGPHIWGYSTPIASNLHETKAVAWTMARHSNCWFCWFGKSDTVFASHYLRYIPVSDIQGLHQFGPLILAPQLTAARRSQVHGLILASDWNTCCIV